MSANRNQQILLIIIVVVIAALTGAWFYYMERAYAWSYNLKSERASLPYFAAEKLAENEGIAFKQHATLSLAMQTDLPNGIVYLANTEGMILESERDALVDWVAKGNVLILKPRLYDDPEGVDEYGEEEDGEEKDEEADEESEYEADLMGDYFGIYRYLPNEVSSVSRKKKNEQQSADANEEAKSETTEKEATEQKATVTPLAAENGNRKDYSSLQFDDASYPLALSEQSGRLHYEYEYTPALLTDSSNEQLRVYPYEYGYVVFVADDFFTNDVLQRHDNAEIWLHLLKLRGKSQQLTLIQHLEMLPWYKALYQRFGEVLLLLMLALMLLLWRSVMRFGPILAPPERERRALMEHVLASATWLWRQEKGRAQMLAALREDVKQRIWRKSPEYARLNESQLCEKVALVTGMSDKKIQHSLFNAAPHSPNEFTATVRLLQKLRKAYAPGK